MFSLFGLVYCYPSDHYCYLIVHLFVLQKVSKSKNPKKIEIPVVPSFSNPSPAAGATESKTIEEYDMGEALKELKQFFLVKGLIVAIHIYFDTVPPVLIQVITTPLALYKSHLIQSYLFGKQIVRPFPLPAGPFDSLKQQMEEIQQQSSDPPKKPRKKIDVEPTDYSALNSKESM